MAAAEQALSSLDTIATKLAADYARPALQPRLEQITAHITSLRSLIEQLPGEEAREAELADRLLYAYDNGHWKSTHPDHGFTHTSDAQVRLAHALEARKNGAAA